MADDVNRHSSAGSVAAGTAPVPVDATEERQERARRTSYRRRFGVVYTTLALVAAVALGTFAFLLVRDAPPEAEGWSSWRPEGSSLAKMQQIAERIPRAYVTADNEQLNIAIARQLVAQVDERAIPVGAIVVRAGATAGGEDVEVHDAAGAVGIALCGLGPQCSVPGGESSDADFALRRQAVELSLYAFKYVDGVDAAVVFLPPTRAGQSNGLVFLRRDDVRDELKRPLDETLPTRTAQVVGEATSEELATVVRLTDARVYGFAYEAAPDGNPILLLTPPGASG